MEVIVYVSSFFHIDSIESRSRFAIVDMRLTIRLFRWISCTIPFSLFPRKPSNMVPLSSLLQSADLCTMVYGVSELLDSNLADTNRLLSVVASSLPPSSRFLVVDPISHQFCCEKEISVARCFPSFKMAYRGHDKVSVSRQILEPLLAPLCTELGLEMSRDVKLSCHTWSLLLCRGLEGESEAKRVCVSLCSGVDGYVDDCVDGYVDDCVDGYVDGCVDGYVNGYVDGYVDGCVDGYVDDCVNSIVNDKGNDGVNDHVDDRRNDKLGSAMNHVTSVTHKTNTVTTNTTHTHSLPPITTTLILTQLPCLTQWTTLFHMKTATNVWIDRTAGKSPNRALFKRLVTAWRLHGGVLLLTYAQWKWKGRIIARYVDVANLLETPVTLLLLHNYDIHCETKNPCPVHVKATVAIATIQTGGEHVGRVQETIRRISGCETVQWEEISSEEILNRNSDKLTITQQSWELTAAQRQLEAHCTTNNLKMLVDVHPALVFDKKLNAGWQKVAEGNGIDT